MTPCSGTFIRRDHGVSLLARTSSYIEVNEPAGRRALSKVAQKVRLTVFPVVGDRQGKVEEDIVLPALLHEQRLELTTVSALDAEVHSCRRIDQDQANRNPSGQQFFDDQTSDTAGGACDEDGIHASGDWKVGGGLGVSGYGC